MPTKCCGPASSAISTLTLREEPNTVVVPREAIQIGQNGNFVFTVDDGVAHVPPVEVGRTQDGETVVAKGLTAARRSSSTARCC